MTPLAPYLTAVQPNAALTERERRDLIAETFDVVRLRLGITSDDPLEVLDRALIFGGGR